MGYIENLLIGLVVLLVFLGIVRLFVPGMLASFGGPPGGGMVGTIIGYIIWGVLAIFLIIFLFSLFSCLTGGGGLHLLH